MECVPYKHLLRCLHQDGRIRYELPAHYKGEYRGYFVYERRHPLILHHGKGKEFTLPYPEIVLVGNERMHHCISIAFNAAEEPVNMYVNINLPPTRHEQGHEWKDLELDLKLSKTPEGTWIAELVDEDEFEQAALSPSLRSLARKEVGALTKKISQHEFPFGKTDFIPLLGDIP